MTAPKILQKRALDVTPHETIDQKLGYLVVECGEVLAAAGQMLRWGLERTNRNWILQELTDLKYAIALTEEALRDKKNRGRRTRKTRSIER